MPMATPASSNFWAPRRPPPRVMDAATRCRPNRMRTSAILKPPKSSVNFQVKTFRIYGKLRKTQTEVHNSLPTVETIETERTLLNFDEKRHVTPDSANYDDFYRTLASSVTPQPSRVGTARSGAASTRSLDSRATTLFTLAPPTPSRPLQSRHSLMSGIGAGPGPVGRPSDSRQSERLSVSGFRSLSSRTGSMSRGPARLTDVSTVSSQLDTGSGETGWHD